MRYAEVIAVMKSLLYGSVLAVTVAVATISVGGCDRKDSAARVHVSLDLKDPTRPEIIRSYVPEFETEASKRGWVWRSELRTIGTRKYISVLLYSPPYSPAQARKGIVLADNEVFVVLVETDANSTPPHDVEFLLSAKIEVELDVKPTDIVQSVTNAITGKPLSEQGVLPPGIYSFRIAIAKPGKKGK
jgi:hypothetical protein